jgi:hypothetical protein
MKDLPGCSAEAYRRNAPGAVEIHLANSGLRCSVQTHALDDRGDRGGGVRTLKGALTPIDSQVRRVCQFPPRPDILNGSDLVFWKTS